MSCSRADLGGIVQGLRGVLLRQVPVQHAPQAQRGRVRRHAASARRQVPAEVHVCGHQRLHRCAQPDQIESGQPRQRIAAAVDGIGQQRD
jgi:hypothetical protein